MIEYNINKYAQPIDYILKCLKDNVMPHKEHVKNARKKWEEIQKETSEKNFETEPTEKFAHPIDFVFYCLEDNVVPDKFHILNAIEQLKNI